MKHRILHSSDLPDRLPSLANEMGVSLEDLQQALAWSLANDVIFEEGAGEGKRFWISSIDIEKRIEQPVARRLYHRLKQDIPSDLVPMYGKNWITLKDRWRNAWDMAYNILINKIPSHHVRLAWLRLGGAKIGKGSSLWRNTEVLGMHNLIIGEDSVVGWHCVVDARAGLVIGDHVAIASHVLIIAGSHDLQAPEFWSVGANRAKIKTPEDFVISAVRAGGIDVEDANVVVKAISDLGQPLYGRQTPDGYSMLSSPWINSAALLARMNFSLSLAGNRLSKGVTADWLSQLGATSLQQPEEQERQIENLLLHGQVSDKTRSLILQQLASAPQPPSQQNSARPIAMAGNVNGAVSGGIAQPKLSPPAPPMTPAQEHQAADRQAALTAGLIFGSPDFQRR